MQLKEKFWNVYLRKRTNEETLLNNLYGVFSSVPNPKNGWAADPFLFEKNNELYIFAELFSYKEWKGSIGYCKYINDGFTPWTTIISNETHFSFPYIYEKDNEVYLMPENNETFEVPVYKAKSFPNKWEKVSSELKNSKYVDSIYLPDNRLMTYCIGKEKYYLEIKDSNIKINDSKYCLRPAGKCFFAESNYYRPSQDCSKEYGGSLIINKIIENRKESFLEDKIIQIYPYDIKIKDELNRNKRIGIHTYNMTNNYETIDIYYERISFKYLFLRLINKITKLLK